MLRRIFGGRHNHEAVTSQPPPVQVLPPPPNSAREVSRSGSFTRYAPIADRVVVVDTETTGVYNSDRVVEVAVITLDLSGAVVDEWDTLVNPCRDVGPVWIHGISAEMVVDAPTFEEVASPLATRLHGAILCAHNLPFDTRMLRMEFDRCGIDVDFSPGFDTLRATGSKLGSACADHGISIDGAHQAIADARATAQLLVRVADQLPAESGRAAIHSPVQRVAPEKRRTRPGSPAAEVVSPPYLAALAARLDHANAGVDLIGYLDLLDRAMADLHLDRDERLALVDLAGELGLDDSQVDAAHRRWLSDLVDLARADGVVDSEEYDQLLRAAHILGLDPSLVERRTVTHRSAEAVTELTAGVGVCFTGVAVDEDGSEIPRETLATHARRLGLVVEDSFTKSRCGLLIAGDPASQSGKAGKARSWGIPIIGAVDFLAANPGDSTRSQLIAVGGREALECARCGRTFTRGSRRGRKPTVCDDCASSDLVPPSRTRRAIESATPDDRPAELVGTAELDDGTIIETYRCVSCGQNFDRTRGRGRKPKRCPNCR
jgi:DNA polymerase-3 subunit epsilon